MMDMTHAIPCGASNTWYVPRMSINRGTTFNFRLSANGHALLERLAETHEVTKSDVYRAALRIAANHPKELDTEIERARDEL